MKYTAEQVMDMGFEALIKSIGKINDPYERRKKLSNIIIRWDERRKILDRLWKKAFDDHLPEDERKPNGDANATKLP